MNRRQVVAVLVFLAAIPMAAAPVTMADMHEGARFSVEAVSGPEKTHDRSPTIEYQDLSPLAQDVVRRTIESPDGTIWVYGEEDIPEDFQYYSSGPPSYGIAYEDAFYRFSPSRSGGFEFVQTLVEIPFMLYGVLLAFCAGRAYKDRLPLTGTVVAAVPAVVSFGLGPPLDFPVLAPGMLSGVALLTSLTILGWFIFRWVGSTLSDRPAA